jgi:drug/metabolite transporter (DMT)-like permease
MLRHEDAAWLVVLNLLVTAAIIAPYIVYLALFQGFAPSAAQLAVLAAFGLFQMGLPYVLFARGVRAVSSQEASGIVLLEPVLTPLWVLLAWGESPASWTYVGGGLILMGLLLRYVRVR